MKERPILFSAPMVRALRAGVKTQTRRVCKVKGLGMRHDPLCGALTLSIRESNVCTRFLSVDVLARDFCPYGVPGDRLVFLCGWAVAKRHDRVRAGKLSKRVKVWTWFDGEKKPEWCGRLRMGRHMPGWMRARMPRGEVMGVRVERAHEISECDAVAEGFDVEMCEEVFGLKAGKFQAPSAYYIEHDGNDQQAEWCWGCAQKEVRKLGGDERYDVRRYDFGDTDGPAWCETCKRLLDNGSLTEYGISRELFLESNVPEDVQHFACGREDAWIARNFAGNVKEEWRGRMAQVGFATLWDVLNGDGSWKGNPWVWRVEFRVIEGLAASPVPRAEGHQQNGEQR